MTLTVKTVESVEIIRNGGSLAAAFYDAHGAKWILYVPIDQVWHDTTVERFGYKPPVLIDADPAKRPPDTDTIFHSELNGPAEPVTWESAKALVDQMAVDADGLPQWTASAWARLRFAVDSQGGLPPDVPRSAPTFKFPDRLPPGPGDA